MANLPAFLQLSDEAKKREAERQSQLRREFEQKHNIEKFGGASEDALVLAGHYEAAAKLTTDEHKRSIYLMAAHARTI